MKKLNPILLALLTSCALNANGDLARTNGSIRIGFGKLKVEDTFSGQTYSTTGFVFGGDGTYALFKDPDVVGLDFTAEYSLFHQSDAYFNIHNFELGVRPSLHFTQYFKPYVKGNLLLKSWETYDVEGTDVGYGLGAGFESEIVENFSITIGYDYDKADISYKTLRVGASYWLQNGLGLGLKYGRSSFSFMPYAPVDFTLNEFELSAGYSF
jgi:opacity protein-like surface antigen